jgi:hypothetical protein
VLARDDRDKPGHFRKVLDGDGASLVYDPEEPGNIFGGLSGVRIYRHPNGHRGKWVNVSPNMTQEEQNLRPIAVMAIDPVRRKGKRDKSVYVGTDRLWRTANWGKAWSPVSDSFDDTPVSAIAIAPDDPDFILVGTTKGRIYRSTDGARTWSENLAGAQIPMRQISSIKIFSDPGTMARVTHSIHSLCAVAATGLGAASLPKLFQPQSGDGRTDRAYSHIFGSWGHCEDGWKEADGGRLPDVAYFCCAFETHPPYRIFVAGAFGVFMGSPDGFRKLEQSVPQLNPAVTDSFQWTNITGNLPHVIVSQLVYHHQERYLYASTYGRGIWRLKFVGAG